MPTPVQPGDLITAELMNSIIQQLNQLLATAGGPNPVPNLFGRTLADAKGLLAQNGSKLRLGACVDASGLAVSATDTRNNSRLIIGQVPHFGARVADDTEIALVLATLAGATPAPPPRPTITNFSPLSPFIGTEVQIIGENFDPVRTNNSVTFDTTAAIPPTNASTRNILYVVVPSMQNPPATGAQKTVAVVVTTPNGTASAQLIVQGPTGAVTPLINSFGTANVAAGAELVINGSGFGASLANVRVFFDDQPRDTTGVPVGVQPGTGSLLPNRLNVTVPATLTGVSAPGESKLVTIRVRVGTVWSPTYAIEIYKP